MSANHQSATAWIISLYLQSAYSAVDQAALIVRSAASAAGIATDHAKRHLRAEEAQRTRIQTIKTLTRAQNAQRAALIRLEEARRLAECFDIPDPRKDQPMPTLEEIWQQYPIITCKQDRIGNLQIWQGESTGTLEEAAYLQNSQDVDAMLEYTNATPEDREELAKGYPITIRAYDDVVCVLFDIPF